MDIEVSLVEAAMQYIALDVEDTEFEAASAALFEIAPRVGSPQTPVGIAAKDYVAAEIATGFSLACCDEYERLCSACITLRAA